MSDDAMNDVPLETLARNLRANALTAYSLSQTFPVTAANLEALCSVALDYCFLRREQAALLDRVERLERELKDYHDTKDGWTTSK